MVKDFLYDLYGKLSLKVISTPLFKKYGFCLYPTNFSLELNYKEASGDNELSFFEWLKIIRLLPKNNLISPTITISGRDPIIRDDFIEILKEASKKPFLAKKPVVNVETKGTFLNNEIIESFIEFKLNSLIILKPSQVTNDDFEKVKKNLLNLKSHYQEYLKYKPKGNNIFLEVRSEINKNNIVEILKDYEFLTNLGADKYTIIYNPNIENALTNEEFNKVRAKIQKMKRYSRTLVEFVCLNNEIEEDENISINTINKCKYPNLLMVISPSGDIFNCLNCKIGNVLEKKFNKILKGLEYKEFLKSLSLGKKCFGACKNCSKII